MKCVSKKEKVKSVSQPTPMRACYVCVILFAKTKSKQSDTKQTLTFIHSFGYLGREGQLLTAVKMSKFVVINAKSYYDRF